MVVVIDVVVTVALLKGMVIMVIEGTLAHWSMALAALAFSPLPSFLLKPVRLHS